MNAKNDRFLALNDTINRVSSFVLSHFLDHNFAISSKNDGSEVTNIDIEAELLAKQLLLTKFPDDGFLGEEHDEVQGTSGFRWVVDPIDGTASFARGVPLFGTLIGIEFNEEAICGAACLPALDEKISAIIGGGVTYQSKSKIGVSTVESIENALVCTTSYDYYKQTNSEQLYSNLLGCGCSIRGWSDCFAYMLLCTGRIDAVLEPLLFPWDIIPWLPIIKEVGGKYSPVAQGGIASNHNLHDTLYHALYDNITN